MIYSIKKIFHPIVTICMFLILLGITNICYGVATDDPIKRATLTNLNTRLKQAVIANNIEQARICIAQGANVNMSVEVETTTGKVEQPLLAIAQSEAMREQLTQSGAYAFNQHPPIPTTETEGGSGHPAASIYHPPAGRIDQPQSPLNNQRQTTTPAPANEDYPGNLKPGSPWQTYYLQTESEVFERRDNVENEIVEYDMQKQQSKIDQIGIYLLISGSIITGFFLIKRYLKYLNEKKQVEEEAW